MVITYSGAWINWVRLPDPARGQLNRDFFFSCPRSRLRIWSRETGSAVPSRVSLLILHTQAESGAYSRDSSRFPRWRPFIYTAIRHRISPEYIGSPDCVPMAFIAESPPARPVVLKVVPALADHHGPINVRLSFPTSTICMKWACQQLLVRATLNRAKKILDPRSIRLVWNNANMPTRLIFNAFCFVQYRVHMATQNI